MGTEVEAPSLEQLERAKKVRGIDNILAAFSNCPDVTKETIDKWIEEGTLRIKFVGGEFETTKGDIEDWISGGFSYGMTFFDKRIDASIITVFEEYDKGKNVMRPQTHRIPLEWEPTFKILLNAFPAFNNNLSNFVRCALWNMMNDLNQLLQINGLDYDPILTMNIGNLKIKAEHNRKDTILESMKVGFLSIKSNYQTQAADHFIDTNTEKLKLLDGPWKIKAEHIIQLMAEMKDKRSGRTPEDQEKQLRREAEKMLFGNRDEDY